MNSAISKHVPLLVIFSEDCDNVKFQYHVLLDTHTCIAHALVGPEQQFDLPPSPQDEFESSKCVACL